MMSLAPLVTLAYANVSGDSYMFDDWHVIEQNPAIRGLDDIPSYFVDISTFTLMPGSRDYRPVWLAFMVVCWVVGDGALRRSTSSAFSCTSGPYSPGSCSCGPC